MSAPCVVRGGAGRAGQGCHLNVALDHPSTPPHAPTPWSGTIPRHRCYVRGRSGAVEGRSSHPSPRSCELGRGGQEWRPMRTSPGIPDTHHHLPNSHGRTQHLLQRHLHMTRLHRGFHLVARCTGRWTDWVSGFSTKTRFFKKFGYIINDL